MLTRSGWIKIALYLTLTALLVTGCDLIPTSTATDTTTPPEPATSTLATHTPTPEAPATETETPSPEPATPTATPTPPPPTSTPLPTVEAPYYEDRMDPSALLASYYNAINRREYARAWDYWESPPNPTYDDFVDGFSDTAAVMAAVIPPTWYEGAAGSAYTSVPTLLSATHTDGTRHNYVGCFVTRRPNLGGPDVEKVWSLFDATLNPTPGNSTDALQLTEACGATLETSYDDQTGAVPLLASYYNAINRGEYTRAWNYWETPPNPTYGDFVDGFADTVSVTLIVRPPVRFEGAAGSVYVSIPTLVSAEHTDGSRHNFVGCFVARRPNLGGPGVEQIWSLYDATLNPTPGNSTDATLLEGMCD